MTDDKEKMTGVITSLFEKSTTDIKEHRKRPDGQSRTSVSSYYNERFAIEVKKLLDDIEQSQHDGMVMYSDFPNLSKSSIYLRINQGLRYLIENLDFDPPNKYRSLYNYTKITREKKGIRISIKAAGSDTPLTAQKIVPEEKTIEWKDRMEAFFEKSKIGEMFEQKNLMLSDEEVLDIKASCLELTNFLIEVDSNHIKILHISPEL